MCTSNIKWDTRQPFSTNERFLDFHGHGPLGLRDCKVPLIPMEWPYKVGHLDLSMGIKHGIDLITYTTPRKTM